MTLTAAALAAIQAATLFVYDASGRMLHTAEPEPSRAPRLFIVRTREGCLVRLRDDVPADLSAELLELAASEPRQDNFESPFARFDEYRRLLSTQAAVERVHCGPAFAFPESAADSGRAELLDERRFPPSLREFDISPADWQGRQPYAAMREAGEPVSICFVARGSQSAAEAGVATRPSHRGRGYAPLVVARWADEIRLRGLIPLYSTSWDNRASRAVARKLGLRTYATDLHVT